MAYIEMDFASGGGSHDPCIVNKAMSTSSSYTIELDFEPQIAICWASISSSARVLQFDFVNNKCYKTAGTNFNVEDNAWLTLVSKNGKTIQLNPLDSSSSSWAGTYRWVFL